MLVSLTIFFPNCLQKISFWFTMTRFLTSFVIIDYLPHKDELSDPVVSVTKAASSDEQAVQLGVDSSSRNQSLSQGLHPPDPSGS